MTESPEADSPPAHMSTDVMELPSAYITVGANGVITEINGEAQRITGLSALNVVGHNITEYMPDANAIDLAKLSHKTRNAHLNRRNTVPRTTDPIVQVRLPDPTDPDNEEKKRKEYFRLAPKVQYYTDKTDGRKHPEFLIQLTQITDIEDKAAMDPLLEIPNRRYLFEQGQRIIERAQKDGKPVTTCMLDIDLFKSVNEEHGHAVGDQVLKMVAKRIQNQTRPTDLVGRYGGEEFAVVLPSTDLEITMDICERIRQSVKKPMKCNGNTTAEDILLQRSASIGIAYVNPDAPFSLASSLLEADTALTAVKHNHKDGISVYVAGESPYIVSFQKNDLVTDVIETTIQIFSIPTATDKKSIEPILVDTYFVRTHPDGLIDAYHRFKTGEEDAHELQVADKTTRENILYSLSEWSQIDTRWVLLFLHSPYAPPSSTKNQPETV